MQKIGELLQYIEDQTDDERIQSTLKKYLNPNDLGDDVDVDAEYRYLLETITSDLQIRSRRIKRHLNMEPLDEIIHRPETLSPDRSANVVANCIFFEILGEAEDDEREQLVDELQTIGRSMSRAIRPDIDGVSVYATSLSEKGRSAQTA